MTNKIVLFDSEKISTLLEEVEDAYFEIPFGNTRYQQETFVVASSITPQRAYRAIGLQLHAALANLREKYHELQVRQIEIEELQEQLNNETLGKFERRKLELKLKHLTLNDSWSRKLLNDVLQEVTFYYEKFKSFPRYTREQFEAGEQLYFQESLSRQLLGITGAKEAIINMMDDVKTIEHIEKAVKELPADKLQEMLMQISSELSGSIQPHDENGNPIFKLTN